MFSRSVGFIQYLRQRIGKVFSNEPDRFFTHLLHHAQIVEKGIEALIIYMKDPTDENVGKIRALEKEADELRRIMLDELNHTFVTPIDREDLSVLSRDLDEVIDFAWTAAQEMNILHVQPTDYLVEMAERLRDGAEELRRAMEQLVEHPRVANDHAVRAQKVSAEMERLYVTALAAMYNHGENAPDNATLVAMMKLRESYRHMFHAGKSLSIAGSTTIDIIVKFFDV